MKYDFFVAGRWRNHKNIEPVVEAIRSTGKTAYCFIENEYDGHGIKNERNPKDIEADMQKQEALADWQTNPTFKKIFEADMNGLQNSEAFVLVFPAGLSAHMELGVAYGLGKKCYAIGEPEKAETLYFMLDQISATLEEFMEQLA